MKAIFGKVAFRKLQKRGAEVPHEKGVEAIEIP
jgi:hypothetical protein